MFSTHVTLSGNMDDFYICSWLLGSTYTKITSNHHHIGHKYIMYSPKTSCRTSLTNKKKDPTLQHILYTVLCPMSTVYCKMCIVHWTLLIVIYTLYTVHCKLYSIHSVAIFICLYVCLLCHPSNYNKIQGQSLKRQPQKICKFL